MLIATDAQHRLVSALDADRQCHYFCPGCTAQVYLRRGAVVAPHFAHNALTTCHIFSEGETAEHIRGKQQLAAWFAAAGYTVKLEAALPALHQRPDILVQRGNQRPLALEFQCSPLSLERLAARTRGYRQNGYRVLWLLGTPYQHHLSLHGKALKFIQYYSKWGCFLLFWQVTTATAQLVYQLLTMDTEPLSYQNQLFNTHQVSVDQLLHFSPHLTVPSIPADQVQQYYRQLMFDRLRQASTYRELQSYCYQRGGTLAQLPIWVMAQEPQVPVLRQPYLAWYLHVFGSLLAKPPTMSDVELTALVWAQLQPLMTQHACIRHSGELHRQLVAALITELASQRVVVWRDNIWHLNQQQLCWQKG